MFLHVTQVRHVEGFKLHLTFNDDTQGEIDLEAHLWGNVFKPLHDPNYFKRVAVDAELGTICWPNDADFAPEFLKEHLNAELV